MLIPLLAGLVPIRWRRSLGAALAGLGVASALVASAAPASAKPHDGKKITGQAAGKGDKKGKAAKAKDKKGTKAKDAKATAASPKAVAPVKSDASSATPSSSGSSSAPITLSLPVQRLSLDNGLRVVLNPDHTSPTVAVAVVYDVGSRNEERGRSGFAHLFEHMMFQGSKNVAKGEHFRLVSGHGGVLNGTTSNDRTNYFEVLPSNELALGLWLEADRMKSLDVSEANFENQRKVVQEEYRMRVSNVAYVPSQLRLEELVFQGFWPYEHSTIGSMTDLDGAKLDWVQDFHKHHYGPNNAVLAISGDFDAAEATRLVHTYFDGAVKVDVTAYDDVKLPEQTSQRTAVVQDDNARTPGILYGWAIPPARQPDHYALELAALLLGDGESSRLHQLVVREKSLAQGISAGTEERRGPSIFTIDAKLSEGAKAGDVEKLVEAEIKALSTKGPSDAEIEKARRQLETAFVAQLQSNLTRARKLGEYETYFGDAGLLNDELPKYLAVTKDDVKRVAAQYLGPTRRTIVETYPAAHAAAKATATQGEGKPAPDKAAPPKKGKGGDDAKGKKGSAAPGGKKKKK